MTNSIITLDPEIQSGAPVFTGTRVPLKSFLDYISTGETIETYLDDFPYVSKKQVYELIALLGEIFINKFESIFNENTTRRKSAN